MVTIEGTDFLLTRSTEKEREIRGVVCLNSSTGIRRERGLELCHEHIHKAQVAAQVGRLNPTILNLRREEAIRTK